MSPFFPLEKYESRSAIVVLWVMSLKPIWPKALVELDFDPQKTRLKRNKCWRDRAPRNHNMVPMRALASLFFSFEKSEPRFAVISLWVMGLNMIWSKALS